MFQRFLTAIKPSRVDVQNSVLGALACFLVLHARTALAASDASGSVTAGMSSSVWNWVVFFTGALVYLAQWVDPANAQTPWNLSAKTRMIAFTVLGLVVGVLHAVTKDPSVPWTDSLMTGVMTVVLPGVLHFAPGMFAKAKAGGGVGPAAGALLLIGALGTSTMATGCAAFTSAVNKDPTVYVADFEMAAGIVNDGAKAIFPIVLAHLPTASQGVAQADFDKAEATYTDAMTAINAGLAGFKDGKAADWGKLLADGVTAIDAIIAIIDEYGGTVTPLGASVHAQTIGPAYVHYRLQLSSAVEVCHKYH
jgi:hypothetical protein